jgi:hypothetical protein
MLLKIVVFISLISLAFIGVSAQNENSPSAGSSFVTDKILQELKLDISSPEDALKLLGKPNKDEFDNFGMGGKKGLFQVNIKSIIETKGNEKAYRKLTFKKLGETNDLTLRFYENKLVQIIFDYDLGKKDKRILANGLTEKFNVDFVILQGVTKNSKLSDFEGQKENTIPKVYEVLYTLLSVQKDKIYFVRIENNNSKAFWRSIVEKPTKEIFPGLVSELHLISRSLGKE